MYYLLSAFLLLAFLTAILVILLYFFLKNRAKKKNTLPPEVRIKKEKARELYYKRLYEEVTKFNISTENLDYEGLQLLADSHGKIGNKKEALNIFEIALSKARQGESDFEEHTILKDRAVMLFNIKEFQATIDMLREYPNEYLNEDLVHGDVSVLAMLGGSFIALQQFEAAIEVLRRADVKKFNKDLIYQLARAYEGKGDQKSLEIALRYYQKIQTVDALFKDTNEKVAELIEKFPKKNE